MLFRGFSTGAVKVVASGIPTKGCGLQVNDSNAEVRIQNYCNRYNLWQPLHLDMPASAQWSNFKHNFAVVAYLFFL